MTIKPVITQKSGEKKENHGHQESQNQNLVVQSVRTNHRNVVLNSKSNVEGQSPQRRDVFEDISTRHGRSPHKSGTRSKRDHHKREQREREKMSSSPSQYHHHHGSNSSQSSSSSGKSPKHGCTLPGSGATGPVQANSSDLMTIVEETFSGYNSGDEHLMPKENLLTPDEWKDRDEAFKKAMSERGFVIKDIIEDGACLFRAISLQIYGDQEMHEVIRQQTMDYIQQNREYFAHFVTEDINSYIKRKRNTNSHGNHIEIQAMSEIYNRPVELYCYKTTPINIFNSAQINNGYDPLRLSYQRGSHYNALLDPYNASVGVGLGLADYKPESQTREAIKLSEQLEIEQTMFEDKLKTTDWEATNEAIEEQIARESYLQWCRENMQQNPQQSKTTSNTISSSSSSSSSTSSSSTSSTVTSAEAHQSNFIINNNNNMATTSTSAAATNNNNGINNNTCTNSSSSSSSCKESTALSSLHQQYHGNSNDIRNHILDDCNLMKKSNDKTSSTSTKILSLAQVKLINNNNNNVSKNETASLDSSGSDDTDISSTSSIIDKIGRFKPKSSSPKLKSKSPKFVGTLNNSGHHRQNNNIKSKASGSYIGEIPLDSTNTTSITSSMTTITSPSSSIETATTTASSSSVAAAGAVVTSPIISKRRLKRRRKEYFCSTSEGTFDDDPKGPDGAGCKEAKFHKIDDVQNRMKHTRMNNASDEDDINNEKHYQNQHNNTSCCNDSSSSSSSSSSNSNNNTNSSSSTSNNKNHNKHHKTDDEKILLHTKMRTNHDDDDKEMIAVKMEYSNNVMTTIAATTGGGIVVTQSSSNLPCTSKQAEEEYMPVSKFYQSLLESSYTEDGLGQLSENEMIKKAIQMSRMDYIEEQKRKYGLETFEAKDAGDEDSDTPIV